MNLVEAFDIVNRRSEVVSKKKRRRAQRRLFEEVQRIGEAMKTSWDDIGDEYEDVIHNAFLKLNRGTDELTNKTEGGARGRIRKALGSVFVDHIRASGRRPQLVIDDDDRGDHQVFDGEVQVSNLEEETILEERLDESAILDAPASAVALQRQLCDYLMEVVIPLKVRREPYRSRAREQVEQMYALREGECTWEDLVDAEVDEDAGGEEREKARNRIQQRHSRTRKRIRQVLDNAGDDERYEAVARLSDFDRRLLWYALDGLRQRRRSDDD